MIFVSVSNKSQLFYHTNLKMWSSSEIDVTICTTEQENTKWKMFMANLKESSHLLIDRAYFPEN